MNAPRHWLRHVRAAVLVAFGAMIACPSAGHAMQAALTDNQLVAQSTHIVRGQVVGLSSEWNQNYSQIYTVVQIRVDETFKGSVPTPWLRLRVLGGVVGDIAMTVYDLPSFERDENVFLFLKENYQALFAIVGGEQGKVTVAGDPNTAGASVKRLRGASMPVADFETTIRKAVADTEPIMVGGQMVPPSDLPERPGGNP